MRLWLGIGKALLSAIFFSLCALVWARVEGADSPWLGLFCMFYVMGTAKSAEPQILFRMPDGLREVDPNAIHAGVRNRWGVQSFGAFLRNTPFRYLNRSVYLTSQQHDFPAVLRKLESAETIHFWAAVLFTPYIVYIAARGLYAYAWLFVLIQVAFNLYPILHLRLVRARLTRLVEAKGRNGCADL